MLRGRKLALAALRNALRVAVRLAPVVAVAWLAACSTVQPPAGRQAPREQEAPVHPQSRTGVAQGTEAEVPHARTLTKPLAAHGSVALLLPFTGPAAHAAAAVRDGFMAAYYLGPLAARPRIQLYDTATTSVALAVRSAMLSGAGFIVGPLTRSAVSAAAALKIPHPPVLALNFLPTDQAGPTSFYQFALSPVQEAREVARRVVADGHRQGIAIVPRGDWGNRVLAAFQQALAAKGAKLLGIARFDPDLSDLETSLKNVLGIEASRERARALESILGPMRFEPRRRKDIDFIFEASDSASAARLLRGEIRYYYAGTVPAYATSDSYEPNPTANVELDGLEFPDMPWMLGGSLAAAVRAAASLAWPIEGPHFGRLFAFGFDAYRLLEALREGSSPGSISIDGLTGTLTIDAQRRVHRKLEWAEMRDGVPQLIPQTGTADVPRAASQPSISTPSGPALSAGTAPSQPPLRSSTPANPAPSPAVPPGSVR